MATPIKDSDKYWINRIYEVVRDEIIMDVLEDSYITNNNLKVVYILSRSSFRDIFEFLDLVKKCLKTGHTYRELYYCIQDIVQSIQPPQFNIEV